ncbi:IclR family transcriptional regulator [Caenispirillum bisanense]|uniref:IclR family transcriptional regulator n=1 Tax=Caenispirillum bisanense TaxID=414052 RepID=UPI0031D233B4
MAENRVEAVERALTVLACFDGEQEDLSLADLAERTGFYKSTILRLIASLERFGYIGRRPDGRYVLGAAVWRLGSAYRRRFALDAVIRPELRTLRDTTGETASFYVRDGDQRVCLYRENSLRPARHHLREGEVFPLTGGASAWVIRAWTGGSDDRSAAVREAGHASSVGERDPDVAAVAVPVLGRDGTFIGALSVSGLASRFGAERREAAVDALRESAARLRAVVV